MHEPPDPAQVARPAAGLRARLSGLSEGWTQLLRFAFVGGLGTVTNLALFYAFVDLAGMDALAGIVVCFGIAVSQNYAFNELWTFATRGDAALSGPRYLKFVAASLVGLGVNTLVYVLLVAFVTFPLKVIPQAVGIAAGTAVNFLASRHLVFQRGEAPD